MAWNNLCSSPANNEAYVYPSKKLLKLILLIALGLRLLSVLSVGASIPQTGGDSLWYLENGYGLIHNLNPGPLQPPPLYLLYLGTWQTLLNYDTAIIVIRIGQCLMGVATCYFAYRIAIDVTRDERVGLLAAGALAISPTFILEPTQITSETLYIVLLSAGLSLYTHWLASGEPHPKRNLALVGLLMGLTTLTRAVLLLFPLGLGIHLLLLGGRTDWRRRLGQAGLLLLIYVLVVSTWTFYNLARWDRLVIGGDGFAAFFYIGATEWDGPFGVDERLGITSDQVREQTLYTDAAIQTISANPLGYITNRLSELAGAYLQPHGTVNFPGESLKEIVGNWLQRDRSLGGLLGLTQGNYFWPKLAIYIFHYAALIGGLIGMWLYRQRWKLTLPLMGFVLYTTLIHLVLLALPRYIFPTEVFWWIFAAAAMAYMWDSLRHSFKRQTPTISTQNTEPAQTKGA